MMKLVNPDPCAHPGTAMSTVGQESARYTPAFPEGFNYQYRIGADTVSSVDRFATRMKSKAVKAAARELFQILDRLCRYEMPSTFS